MFLALDRAVTGGLWRHMWSLRILFKGKAGTISGMGLSQDGSIFL